MLGWFKKKAGIGEVGAKPTRIETAKGFEAIGWEPDAYRSARFLMGMYASKSPPFSNWKKPGAQVTPGARLTAEICVHSYQLSIWFWRFDQEFGPLAGQMARDAFLIVAEELAPDDGLSGMLQWLLAKHEEVLQSYVDIPADKKRITVNGEAIELPRSHFTALFFYINLTDSPYYGSTEVPDNDLYGLMESLEHATSVANEVFTPMLAAIQFNPSSFVTWRWSEKPGAYEMHLARRQNNPLFSLERQVVGGADIYSARVQDAKEWNAVLDEALAIRKELLDNELPPDWTDFLSNVREKIDELLTRAHRLGSNAKVLVDHLYKSRQFISGIWIDAHKDRPEAQQLYKDADQMHALREATMFGTGWIAQVADPLQVVPPDELIATLLCQDAGDISETVRILALDEGAEDGAPRTSQLLGQLRTGALKLVLPLQAAGHPLPGIAEKLKALGLSL